MNYQLRKTPPWYKCTTCQKTNRKLWRPAGTTTPTTLYCATCAAKTQNTQPPQTMNWTTDQIGNMVPAVPQNQHTYYQYTTVPPNATLWWQSLNKPNWTPQIILKDLQNTITQNTKRQNKQTETQLLKLYPKEYIKSLTPNRPTSYYPSLLTYLKTQQQTTTQTITTLLSQITRLNPKKLQKLTKHLKENQ